MFSSIFLLTILSIASLYTLTSTNLMSISSVIEPGNVSFASVTVADVDMDGKREIVAVGSIGWFPDAIGLIKIYDLDLNREATITIPYRELYTVDVGDYDCDGITEILVGGIWMSGWDFYIYLAWLSWNGSKYVMEYENTSSTSGMIYEVSQPIDVDLDDAPEFLYIGYDDNLGQPMLAHGEYNRTHIVNHFLHYIDVESIDTLKVGQYDTSQDIEIIIGGTTYVGEVFIDVFHTSSHGVFTQLDNITYLPASPGWPIYNSMDIGKLDNDEYYDIVAVGSLEDIEGMGIMYPFLTVYEWDGNSLMSLAVLEDEPNVYTESFEDVSINDVDFDNITEIIIAGYNYTILNSPPSNEGGANLGVLILNDSSIAWDNGSLVWATDFEGYASLHILGDIIVVAGVGDTGGCLVLYDAHPEQTTLQYIVTSTTTMNTTSTTSIHTIYTTTETATTATTILQTLTNTMTSTITIFNTQVVYTTTYTYTETSTLIKQTFTKTRRTTIRQTLSVTSMKLLESIITYISTFYHNETVTATEKYYTSLTVQETSTTTVSRSIDVYEFNLEVLFLTFVIALGCGSLLFYLLAPSLHLGRLISPLVLPLLGRKRGLDLIIIITKSSIYDEFLNIEGEIIPTSEGEVHIDDVLLTIKKK